MPDYEIIVTDVTCYGTKYCVAGWNLVNGGMIRPEPSTTNVTSEASRFWGAADAGPGRVFALGNVVRFSASLPPANFPFPHATEDRVVAVGRAPVILRQLALSDVAQAVVAGISPDIRRSFSGMLIRANSGKAYVPTGTNGKSLDAVLKTPNQISFFENTFNNIPKLRARVSEGGIKYDFSVTADSAKTIWRAGGLNALNANLRRCQQVHLRLGLSRPMAARPDECFAQINGLYFLN